jgi:hypothetical protein
VRFTASEIRDMSQGMLFRPAYVATAESGRAMTPNMPRGDSAAPAGGFLVASASFGSGYGGRAALRGGSERER